MTDTIDTQNASAGREPGTVDGREPGAADGRGLRPVAEAIGLDLGTRRVAYTDREAILYALAVGAAAEDLDLVFERDLRVLPTFGLGFGLWACDELGARNFFSSTNALHGAQRLEVLAPFAASGELEMSARVLDVWDKGSAAVCDIEVACEQFRAVYSIFAPGQGGWDGERGPGARRDPEAPPTRRARVATSRESAVLYRLLGDRHLIHVDPEAARAIGQPRPILHGLCTLGIAARSLPPLFGRRPDELISLEARFAAAVLPGEPLELRAWEPTGDGSVPFSVATPESVVLSGGLIRFG
ncbi:MAG TPA: MaoC/PaaZ C-terminal domain-containing protein [Solirubrobacterales bacterium]|nr:MaoC/PaaZ C-terminal domain-containing protein [Solirubrobacterales bacterium]